MSNTFSGMVAKTFNVTLNDTPVVMGLTNFVCMANDYFDGSSWGGSKEKAVAAVEKRQIAYAKREEKPAYFISSYENTLKDNEGSVVYKTPEGFNGTHDEYDLEKYEVVGTLLKKGRVWYIETDEIKIEEIRRERECESMNEGRLTVFFSDNQEDNSNPEKYKEYLLNKDKENGSIVVRGHGI